MRAFPQELFILRLKGKATRNPRLNWLREMSEEECVEKLKELSGQDFGSDVEAWGKWWKEERSRLDIDPDYR